MTSPHRWIAIGLVFAFVDGGLAQSIGWEKHDIVKPTASQINSAIAHDWDRDGHPEVITSYDNQVVLLKGPEWKPVVVDRIVQGRSRNKVRTSCMHSCLLDVDRDGDLDYVGSNSTVFWLECPAEPFSGEPWEYRVVDDEILGTHCLVAGDVNQDGRMDLIANSGRPSGTPFAESLVWLEVPSTPQKADSWIRHIYARPGEAPANSHYAGFGDVNGDGRPDIAYGAKGVGNPPLGGWFAWWEQPEDPDGVWEKHLLASKVDGATNIVPADIDGDGQMDYVATRGHAKGILWFRGKAFTPVEIDSEILNPHSLAVADLDQDGDLDAVTCSKDGNGHAVWYENRGGGTFDRRLIGSRQGSYDTRVFDMDGDSDLDVLIAGHTSRNVVWFENPHLNP